MKMRMLERVIADIDHLLENGQEQILVAIDGNCASGKTTLASRLQEHYDCNVFHMDHFFLRPEQRTEERLAKPGGNVDYERFQQEVLEPLLENKAFSYRIYDCREQKLTRRIEVQPARVNIIEGAYSRHPYFGDPYQLHYWMFISPDEQRRRILVRNGAGRLAEFMEKWIPLENAYLDASGAEEWKTLTAAEPGGERKEPAEAEDTGRERKEPAGESKTDKNESSDIRTKVTYPKKTEIESTSTIFNRIMKKIFSFFH